MTGISIRKETNPPHVVLSGDGNKRPYFPDITRLANGELLIFYYWNCCHVPAAAEQEKGIIRMVRSIDEGETWSEPATVVDWRLRGLEARDPNILELSDGALLLTFFTFSYTREKDYLQHRQTYAMRSIDGGRTWSEPAMITGRNVWNARQGTAAVLENGEIMIALYGSHDYRTALNSWRISVIRSRDGGMTWGDETEIAVSSEGEEYNETALIHASGGTIYALAREPGTMFRSTDAGRTWEKQFTIGPVHRPHFLKLTDSIYWVTWSNPAGADYGQFDLPRNRRVMGNLLDLDEGWSHANTRVIYDSVGSDVFDMGYSSSALLSHNRILTVCYDTSRSELIGIYVGID